jgi:L-ascorbate metabolism protein UlaG (beta-lactamase superfamily)
MRLTHYGHACVLLELPQRVLIDPGAYSAGFEQLEDLDLVLVTHAHPDHLDVDRLRALVVNNRRSRSLTPSFRDSSGPARSSPHRNWGEQSQPASRMHMRS